MAILGEWGLSGWVKRFLDAVFLGGAAIYVTLPFLLRWYLTKVYPGSRESFWFMIIFLYFSGLFCLAIVWELRKIFKTINRNDPFMMDNVNSLKRIALCAFCIAAAYIFKIVFYNTILTMVITMAFIIAGLFSMVFAEVFRQAVLVKQENDLTI